MDGNEVESERKNSALLEGLNDIADEIVIDANMDLQWPYILSLMPPSPTCSALDPLQSGFEPWTPYKVGLCLEAPCSQLTRSLYPQGWILEPPPY